MVILVRRLILTTIWEIPSLLLTLKWNANARYFPFGVGRNPKASRWGDNILNRVQLDSTLFVDIPEYSQYAAMECLKKCKVFDICDIH